MFGQVNNQLRSELKAFWDQNNKSYQDELKSFRSEFAKNRKSMGPPKKTISRQPAAISRDQSGLIDGVVFVVLQELDNSIGLGSHAYFQRMYIIPESRRFGLTNRLFRVFLQGFDRAAEKRDHRANALLAENINPGLQKASMRRYFARLGFQMLGGNQLGGEIWARKLKTHFSF
ncbi:hypothetical protein [Synechococcus sp. RS9916]|uniref:hypothetical protein n=1 Tax=Synechococcus sp. RS9916 TaxID=221359 RepID=UPI001E37926A|nr:hypothetical protein [Synechococcus sp. RS9916]